MCGSFLILTACPAIAAEARREAFFLSVPNGRYTARLMALQ